MQTIIDWNKISDSGKRELKQQQFLFVCGSREMSETRIKILATQLNKQKQPVLWGCLKDEYIPGLEGSPQFRTLTLDKLPQDATIINYYYRDWNYILQELKPAVVILINGSWHRMLHRLTEFWTIVNNKIPYKLLSPFVDEVEARDYEEKLAPEIKKLVTYSTTKRYGDKELMALTNQAAKQSYAWDWQTGVVLAKQGKVLAVTHNRVVPYETYALHNGSVKEKNFSPANDLNYYDTNHAEMELLLTAVAEKLNLADTSLFINLLPCPTCTRILLRTPIKEIVYSHDHSDGYAFKLLTEAGKIVRRLPQP